MSTFQQMKTGFNRAWDAVTEGWRELVDRASDALTRFQPSRNSSDLESREQHIERQGSRWGLLAAEVRMDDDEVCVDMEIPGMEPGDFEIQVIQDTLVVRGEKKVERQRRDGQYHVMERAYGAFERAVRLPTPVEESKAKADYKRGVLHIRLPRSSAHRPRRINVQQV